MAKTTSKNISGDQQSSTEATIKQTKSSFFGRLTGHHNAHWWLLTITSLILFVLLTTWLVGSLYYKQTVVGNSRLAHSQLDSQLQTTLDGELKAYRLQIASLQEKEGIKSYKLSELGIEIDESSTVTSTKNNSNYWRNRLLWWQPLKADVSLKIDNNKLINFVNDNTRSISKPVKNASLSVGPEGEIVVTAESKGAEKSLGNGQLVITQAVKNLDSNVLRPSDREIQPTITTETIKDSRQQLEELLAKPVSFTVAENTIQPSAHDIASWLNITPDEDTKSYKISIEKTKLSDYINGQVARFIARPVNQVEVVLPSGQKSILVTGKNGSDVTNIDEVIASVQERLMKEDSLKFELTVAYTPFKTITAPAGNKLIEVDTTNKVMYAYENKVLLRTMYISAGAAATPTVTGTFSIYSKLPSQNMSGFNADGSTYYQPNVPYVNYFYRDYAIHGNYWRPTSYFGSVNSSHGCVGILDADAKWIYDWAPIGTPVVVHN
jgi:lipoprotein-anchoring transpeptidase ErfK/SrfK